MTNEICWCCSARETALRFFEKEVPDGEVGAFVDGLMEAVARVAASHVTPGREADERQILVDEIARRFDRAVEAVALVDAAEATKH